MFRVTDSGGGVMYTRNGEFQVDKNNFIVNAQGYRLTGYPANAIGANPVELRCPPPTWRPRPPAPPPAWPTWTPTPR